MKKFAALIVFVLSICLGRLVLAESLNADEMTAAQHSKVFTVTIEVLHDVKKKRTSTTRTTKTNSRTPHAESRVFQILDGETAYYQIRQTSKEKAHYDIFNINRHSHDHEQEAPQVDFSDAFAIKTTLIENNKVRIAYSSSHLERRHEHDTRVVEQKSASVIVAPLGQWVQLLNNSKVEHSPAIIHRTSPRNVKTFSISLKVELADNTHQ